jgi:hypothetical protein
VTIHGLDSGFPAGMTGGVALIMIPAKKPGAG